MAFDRRAGRLVALAGDDDPVETWTFDVCTKPGPGCIPTGSRRQGTDQLVYDVDSDLTIASDGTRTWVYDLKANTWTGEGGRAPAPA